MVSFWGGIGRARFFMRRGAKMCIEMQMESDCFAARAPHAASSGGNAELKTAYPRTEPGGIFSERSGEKSPLRIWGLEGDMRNSK